VLAIPHVIRERVSHRDTSAAITIRLIDCTFLLDETLEHRALS
jgi:hypothetical protein